MTLYYFGCWKDKGHFLHDPSGRFYGYRGVGPFDSRNLDTVYAPRRPPAYGEAPATETNLVHTNGWTVLAMWDNSVDTRPGSNAAFIAEGEHDEAAMWALARQHYPWIVERLKAANVQRPVGAPARAAEWHPLEPDVALYMGNTINLCCDQLTALAATPEVFPEREPKITAALRMAAREFLKSLPPCALTGNNIVD